MVAPSIAILYPTLLASLASNPNNTLFADEHGTTYLIDSREPQIITQDDLQEITDAAIETTFLLYTIHNKHDGQQLFINDEDSVKKSFWNPARATRIVTHGWRGDTKNPSACTTIRDAYLDTGNYNVILVDWSKAAGSYLYWKVVRSVPIVADRVTQLIDFLQSKAGLDPSKTRVVGHSLGGHAAGLASRNAIGAIAEVIALDPARPFFESTGPGQRVDKSDATVVHVIHTSSLGLKEPLGHADFYPNGGSNQPGCGYLSFACAHSRAYEYYAESVLNPIGFRAGDVFMGGPLLDRKASGEYTLKTADTSPFALG